MPVQMTPTTTAIDWSFLAQLNYDRAAQAQQPLLWNNNLAQAAVTHNNYMSSKDLFTHDEQDAAGNNLTLFQQLDRAGFKITNAGNYAEYGLIELFGPPEPNPDIAAFRFKDGYYSSPNHGPHLIGTTANDVELFGSNTIHDPNFQGYDILLNSTYVAGNEHQGIVGTVFNDLDRDTHYDTGEGIAGLTVKAVNTTTGAIFTETVNAYGGYSFDFAAADRGGYDITLVSSSGAVTAAKHVTVGTDNILLDFANPSFGANPPPPLPADPAVPSTNKTVSGGAGNDVLVGQGNQNELFHGNAGNDTIQGAGGNDLLYGDAGNDRFVFAPLETGHDRIADFQASVNGVPRDTIQFKSGAFTDFADLMASTTDTQGGALIKFDNPDHDLFIANLHKVDLHPQDFLFV